MTNDAPEEGRSMLRIYVLAMAGVVATTAGVIALDQTMARADWDETAPMTKTLNDDSASLGNQFFHVEWQATPGRRAQEDISGYVYDDAGNAAVSVELRITGLDASGQNVADVARESRARCRGTDAPSSTSACRAAPPTGVAVTSFDFIEPRGAK
jgi:hypothetical protein